MALQHSTDDDFFKLIEDHSRVIVKYYADWCGTCKLFTPKFRRLSEDDRFENILFLEINAEDNSRARKMAGVNNLPYFGIFKNAQIIEGQSTSKEEVVIEMLNSLK